MIQSSPTQQMWCLGGRGLRLANEGGPKNYTLGRREGKLERREVGGA